MSAKEMTTLSEEVAQLRREVAMLRNKLGCDEEDQKESDYLWFDAETIGIRDAWENIPLILQAHEGKASLCLRDKKHVARATLEVHEKAACLEFRNAQGNVVVAIGEAQDGSGIVYVFDKDGKPRAGLRVNEIGGLVTTTNPDGKAQALLQARPEGGTVLVADAEGRAAAKMHADENGGTILTHEKTGAPMSYMTSAGKGGAVGVFSEQGDQVAVMGSDENGGAIMFYDSDGNVRSSLP